MSTILIKITVPSYYEQAYLKIFKWLVDIGLQLENPGSGLVTYFKGTGEGPQETSAETALRWLSRREEGSAQLWFQSEDGPFVTWNSLNFEIHLDGQPDDVIQRVLMAVMVNMTLRANRQYHTDWSAELVIE